mgnify:CR=1 FL=1
MTTWNGKVTDNGQGYNPSVSFEFCGVESPAWSAGFKQWDTIPEWANGVSVAKNGNAYKISPGGDWSAWRLSSYGGHIAAVKGNPVLALADQGRWSGGRTYSGYIFAHPGDIVKMTRKDKVTYLVFSGDKPEVTEVNPMGEYVPL